VRVAEESLAELKREHEANARLRGQLAGLESLRLPETLKVDSIDAQYRNGYVHALADMRDALEMPDALTRTFAPTQALREDEPAEVFVPRTERQRWVDIAEALNAAHTAGMPVGVDLDGTLTDHRMWSVVWDRAAERWAVAGYEADE
jgi:hypothetical protein